jgi:hypothetical protein
MRIWANEKLAGAASGAGRESAEAKRSLFQGNQTMAATSANTIFPPFHLSYGCVGCPFPEMAPYSPQSRRDEASKAPASERIPARVEKKVSGE